MEAVIILKKTKEFKIEEKKITQTLFEIRQSAISQKNNEIYKEILQTSTPEALIEFRKRAPKTAIQGRLVKLDSGEPLAQTIVFLAEMKNRQECIIYSDLMTTTNTKGNFSLKNVPNGYYTVIYSKSEKSKVPASAVFVLDSKEFDTAFQKGSFSGGRLSEGTLAISSSKLGLSLTFEVRDSNIVEFDVFGPGQKKLVFEVH